MPIVKIRDTYTSQILSNIFCEILEIGKIKEKKKRIYHSEIILKSNYYLNITEALKEVQVLANISLIFRTKSNVKKP